MARSEQGVKKVCSSRSDRDKTEAERERGVQQRMAAPRKRDWVYATIKGWKSWGGGGEGGTHWFVCLEVEENVALQLKVPHLKILCRSFASA
jgi:hypothetical protein